MRTTSQLITQLTTMKANKAFKNYIEYIQFPYFRNLEKDTRITFDFPLTVFVGQNGSGKSSTLHALFGAPKKNTPFDFWFSTAVDPIKEVSDGGDRHCFFYAYKDGRGRELEVLKLRILKRNNPDYWETSRPYTKYGMSPLPSGKRNEPIEKNVVYIDFRSELSAFDKYFYFKNPHKSSTIKNKQDYLRKYSVFLRRIIDGTERIITRYGIRRSEPLKNLSSEELEWISYILGKEYVSGKIVKHRLFDDWGYSVIFETITYTYSEAFAGSGEMAVVRLVLEVLSAAQYSLVLLDEPEVSLHPGAQKRLKQFLLDQMRLKQLQVIISTHSPSLIEELPSSAIKVFSQTPTGKFNVKSEIIPEEAFYHLEQTNPNKKTIIVEDHLAKEMVSGVLSKMGPAISSLFEVSFYSGGASVLKKNFITVYSRESIWNKYVIFDGDQNKCPHFNPDSIIELEQTNAKFQVEILNQTGCDVVFYPDSNPDPIAKSNQEKALRKQYLKYFLKNVFYLPQRIPEDIIWNQQLAEQVLLAMGDDSTINKINSATTTKEKFRLLSVALVDDSTGIELYEKMFLKHWLHNPDNNYNFLVDTINTIRNSS
ncbi:MAG: AAA family ATPase [Bacteroidetes bacterium]|nr:AAA family ATPase [Bacteroidota bacterium]